MTSLPLSPLLTAPELANLSLSQDAAVRAKVAAHPNTSPFTLGQLATQFPAEVLRNPALPLLRLADPGFTRGWPNAAFTALLNLETAPAWLRQQVMQHPNTELPVALATHPALTAAEVTHLANHAAWLVRARIAARPDLSGELREQLARDHHYAVRLAVATRHDLPFKMLHSFLGDPSRFVQQEARRQLQPRGT